MDADRQAQIALGKDEARRKIVEALLRLQTPGGAKPLIGAGLDQYPRQGDRTMAVRG